MPIDAIVAVIPRDERVLIIQRAAQVEGAGYWTLPSGKLNPGETQAQAVERETAEELGIQVKARSRVWQCPAWGDKYLLHWWLADYLAGELRPDPTEISQASWMRIEEFLALEPTFEDDRYFFTDIYPSFTRRGCRPPLGRNAS